MSDLISRQAAKELDTINNSTESLSSKQASKWENAVIEGDCLEKLKQLPDGIVDCCVTSPPYYALRDYGVDGQIGLESTPEEYIHKLVLVFREIRRVLKQDGTLWLNIADSYWGSGSRGYDFTGKFTEASAVQSNSQGTVNLSNVPKLVGKNEVGIKDKDLIGIPWMLALALRNDGWYLRQDIIWAKPNPMPESVKDRCTKSHEYLFLLSKSQKYYFDYEAIQEDAVTEPQIRDKNAEGYQADYAKGDRFSPGARVFGANGKRNKRDVWTISVKPTREAHFATYPEDLVKPCILAGSRVGGLVLDPFFGSGTTGRVAVKLNRSYIGIELNPKYIEIEKRRMSNIQMTLEGLI